jgi:hypothetical protein
MASYQVEMPDGARYQLDAQDESALDPVIDQLRAQHTPQAPADPSAGGGSLSIGPWDTGIKTPQALDRTLSGYGESAVNLGRGAVQRATELGQGLAASEGGASLDESAQAIAEQRANVAEQRRYDAPLNATTAGKTGNLLGTVVNTVPALAIPGANTVAGASLIGGGLGALQPSTSNRETLINTGVGAGAGAAGQFVGNKASQFVTNRLAARQSAAQAAQTQNAVRDATLQEGRQAGYIVPPTDVNPSATATAVESFAGKAATRGAARAQNSVVTDQLVGGDLGLTPGAPITRQAVRAVRGPAGTTYDQVGAAAGQFPSDAQYAADVAKIAQGANQLSTKYPGIGSQANQDIQALVKSLSVTDHDGAAAVELSKFLRNRASTNFRAAFASGGDPEKLALARAQSAATDAIEDLIGRRLSATGNGQLAQQWDNARTLIAKSYQAESAFKGGHFDAVKLAAQMNKGKPVSGGMGIAARFGDSFPAAAGIPKGGVGVSKLGATVALGGLVTGHPLLAALPFASAGTRGALLSGAGQRLFASPSYAPGLMGTGALNAVGRAGRYGGLLAPASALVQSAP